MFGVCPRCGLSIRAGARSSVIAHCPRCLARAEVRVALFGSPLPADQLYREGWAPTGQPELRIASAGLTREGLREAPGRSGAR